MTKAKHPGGRPSSFKPEYCEQAEKLCRLGATDKDIADFFSVHVDTVNNWKKKHSEFFDSLKRGKLVADMNVADSLYRNATGYDTAKEVVSQGEVVSITEHVKPETTAQIFWLKNRRPDQWRDRIDQTKTHDVSDKLADLIRGADGNRDISAYTGNYAGAYQRAKVAH